MNLSCIFAFAIFNPANSVPVAVEACNINHLTEAIGDGHFSLGLTSLQRTKRMTEQQLSLAAPLLLTHHNDRQPSGEQQSNLPTLLQSGPVENRSLMPADRRQASSMFKVRRTGVVVLMR